MVTAIKITSIATRMSPAGCPFASPATFRSKSSLAATTMTAVTSQTHQYVRRRADTRCRIARRYGAPEALAKRPFDSRPPGE